MCNCGVETSEEIALLDVLGLLDDCEHIHTNTVPYVALVKVFNHRNKRANKQQQQQQSNLPFNKG